MALDYFFQLHYKYKKYLLYVYYLKKEQINAYLQIKEVQL